MDEADVFAGGRIHAEEESSMLLAAQVGEEIRLDRGCETGQQSRFDVAAEIVAVAVAQIARQSAGFRWNIARLNLEFAEEVAGGRVREKEHRFSEGLFELGFAIQEPRDKALLDLGGRLKREHAFTEEDGAGGAVQHRLEKIKVARFEAECGGIFLQLEIGDGGDTRRIE